MIDYGLNGKVAVVTGGNSGIGSAVSMALAQQGVKVAIHYHPGKVTPNALHAVPGRETAEQLVAEIASGGGRAVAIGANLLDPEAAQSVFESAIKEFGTVGLLINNAAHCEASDTLVETSAGALDRHFAVNARAAVLLCQQLALRLPAGNEGAVVNLSTDGSRAFAGQIAYGASKHALEALTRSMAIELGPTGIRVNAIAPGPVQTGWITPELEVSILSSIPLRRVGTPEEIADGVLFLCSSKARWITGQVIQIAGGHAL